MGEDVKSASESGGFAIRGLDPPTFRRIEEWQDGQSINDLLHFAFCEIHSDAI